MLRKVFLPLALSLTLFAPLGCSKNGGPAHTVDLINTGMQHHDKSLIKDYVDMDQVGPTFSDYIWDTLQGDITSTIQKGIKMNPEEVKAVLDQRQDIKGRILEAMIPRLFPVKPLFGEKPFKVLSVKTADDNAYVKSEVEGDSNVQFEFTMKKEGDSYVLKGISNEYWGLLWPKQELEKYLPSASEIIGFFNSKPAAPEGQLPPGQTPPQGAVMGGPGQPPADPCPPGEHDH